MLLSESTLDMALLRHLSLVWQMASNLRGASPGTWNLKVPQQPHTTMKGSRAFAFDVTAGRALLP